MEALDKECLVATDGAVGAVGSRSERHRAVGAGAVVVSFGPNRKPGHVTCMRMKVPGRQTGDLGSTTGTEGDERRKAHPQQWMQQASMHIKPESPVAIICRTGNRSKTVGTYLVKEHGYQNVYNVTGGIVGWLAKGNPTVRVK